MAHRKTPTDTSTTIWVSIVVVLAVVAAAVAVISQRRDLFGIVVPSPPPVTVYANSAHVQQLHSAVASGSTACLDYPASITVSELPPSGDYTQSLPLYHYVRNCTGPTFPNGELDEALATIQGYDCYILYGTHVDPGGGVSLQTNLVDPENLERPNVPPPEVLAHLRRLLGA